ncbi:MAG: hypothetical protein WCR51_11955 [Planctomycetia bacterium]
MSEEKTRIVPRADAKAGGATITFQCENGHRINVPAKLAGKRGTCSKCGIAVVIPLAGPPHAAPAPGSAPNVAGPAAPEPDVGDVAAATPEPASPAVDQFADLFDGAGVAALAAEQVAIDINAGAEESITGGGSAVGDVVAGYAPEQFAAPDETTVVENPTAQLVARLWLERGHGGVVELHLAGGGVILPEWYEARWSRGTHGLFASQAADGTVTLTAVAWESIQKIVVRQVEGLPDGMFE